MKMGSTNVAVYRCSKEYPEVLLMGVVSRGSGLNKRWGDDRRKFKTNNW